jgi:hypothetical protein
MRHMTDATSTTRSLASSLRKNFTGAAGEAVLAQSVELRYRLCGNQCPLRARTGKDKADPSCHFIITSARGDVALSVEPGLRRTTGSGDAIEVNSLA